MGNNLFDLNQELTNIVNKKDFSKAKVAWLIGSEEYGDFDSTRCLKVHFGL